MAVFLKYARMCESKDQGRKPGVPWRTLVKLRARPLWKCREGKGLCNSFSSVRNTGLIIS